MKIKELTKTYSSKKINQIGKSSNLFSEITYFLGWLRSYIVHGASFNDYFVYKFFNLNHKGKKEYITYRRYKKILSICNSKSDFEICRNKAKFNQTFNDFLGRNWIDLKESSKEEIEDFLNKAKVTRQNLFIKEALGFRGSSVSRVTSENQNYEYLKSVLDKDPQGHYILEEAITQEGPLKDYHPWSINTLRIVTVYDDKKDIVHLMDASLRVGNNKRFVDNLHFGGIAADIDIETGMILGKGFDSNKNFYIKHPVTGVQFIGFKVPYWNECIEYVKKVARKLPTVRYVGWDIVSKGDGTFCLIEANDNADHDIQQIPRGPLWKNYKTILKDLK